LPERDSKNRPGCYWLNEPQLGFIPPIEKAGPLNVIDDRGKLDFIGFFLICALTQPPFTNYLVKEALPDKTGNVQAVCEWSNGSIPCT
jgi:hypothetical protein